MTLDKARELLSVQAGFGGGYNRNGARLILEAVEREHGREARQALTRELGLDRLFGFDAGGPAAPGS